MFVYILQSGDDLWPHSREGSEKPITKDLDAVLTLKLNLIGRFGTPGSTGNNTRLPMLYHISSFKPRGVYSILGLLVAAFMHLCPEFLQRVNALKCILADLTDFDLPSPRTLLTIPFTVLYNVVYQ